MLGGVQKTNEFLDKATWGLATALLVLVLSTNITGAGTSSETQSNIPAQSEMEMDAGTYDGATQGVPSASPVQQDLEMPEGE